MPGSMMVSISATIRIQSSARKSAAISGPMPGRRTFTATRFAGLQSGLVDAGQRRGADRDGVENLEHIAERPADIALDDFDGLLRRESRCLVEHLAQLDAVGIRQHVGTHGQLLCELGEGRAGTFEYMT